MGSLKLLTVISVGFLAVLNTVNAQNIPSSFDLNSGDGYQRVALAPDGKRLAYVQSSPKEYCIDRFGQIKSVDIDDCREDERVYRLTYVFGIADVTNGQVTSVNSVALPDDTFIGWIRWANNDRILASLVRRSTFNKQTGRSAVGGSRILSFDRDLEQFATLFGNLESVSRNDRFISSINNILPNDPDHVAIAAQEYDRVDLWKVNILTGEAEEIAEGNPDTYAWFTNTDGQPYLRFDVAGASLGITLSVHAFDPQTGNWEKVRSQRIQRRWDGEEELEFVPLAPTANPDQVIVLTNEDGDPRRAIRVYDYRADVYTETLFEHPDLDVSEALINQLDGSYMGAVYFDDRLQIDFVDPDLQSHYRAMQSFFNNEYNIEILNLDSERTYAVLRVDAPADPGGYYLYDFANYAIEPIYPRRPGLLQYEFGRAEALRIPTRDGTQITAYLTHPATGPDPDAPLIVMPHGGPEARDILGFDTGVQFLATRGYQVVQMNFRGSDGYGREFAEAGYGEWGGVMQNDVTDTVMFLHDNGLAPRERTCIFGASYGGYVALAGATKTPELYKCVISTAGISDLREFMDQTRMLYKSTSDIYDYLQEIVGHPSDEKEKLEQNSPVNFADQVTAPVLLVHGEYDGLVRIEQSERMFSALKRADADVQFLKIENEGHSGWSLKNEMLYLETVEAFLTQHLPASP